MTKLKIKFGTLLISCLITYETQSNDSFPISMQSCSGWDATVIEAGKFNSSSAYMIGKVTKENIKEYCERDPGGYTIAYGGSLTLTQCIDKFYDTEKDKVYRSDANCSQNYIKFTSDKLIKEFTFPISPTTDTSCASGMIPLQSQYKYLCLSK